MKSEKMKNSEPQPSQELINQLNISQLQTLIQQNNSSGDEIDLAELWRAIWAGKWIVIAVTLIFSVTSVLYAFSLPNLYKSDAVLAPVEQTNSGIGGMASAFGGLASLAGVNLGGGKLDKTSLAIEIMKSRAFVFKFIEKHEVRPDLIAVKQWDSDNNRLIYDGNVYDIVTKKWLRKVKAPLLAQPSLQESYKAFQKAVNIEQDKINSLVSISVKHYSPYIAKKWVNWLIDDINEEMRIRDLREAENSVVYLNKQIDNTKNTNMQKMLYQLIEEQTKTIMFANVREQYVLKTIDPAFVPEQKSSPRRELICVLGIFLGFFIGLFLVLVTHFRRLNSSD